VTPEASDHLAKAREYLSKARNLLDVLHYSDEAARAAYLAGFHAAQALLSSARRGPRKDTVDCALPLPSWQRTTRIDRTLTRFLARAYKSKEISDYGIGPEAVVSSAEAQEMIDLAARFVDRITKIVGNSGEPPA
jgi:uncharacterized protein (UPF0332 family)